MDSNNSVPEQIVVDLGELFQTLVSESRYLTCYTLDLNVLVDELVLHILERQSARCGVMSLVEQLEEQLSSAKFTGLIHYLESSSLLSSIAAVGFSLVSELETLKLYDAQGEFNYRFDGWVTPTAVRFVEFKDFEIKEPNRLADIVSLVDGE